MGVITGQQIQKSLKTVSGQERSSNFSLSLPSMLIDETSLYHVELLFIFFLKLTAGLQFISDC